MKTSERGRAFIAAREGLRLTAYPDPATGGAPWTIGVGHTSAAGPPAVSPGLRISRKTALAILARDLARFEEAVSAAIRVPLAAHEFDALVSLAFNIGPGRFAGSTLARRLNAGDRPGAAAAFGDWTRAAGRVLPGLVLRRQAERRLFASGDYGALPKAVAATSLKPAAPPAPPAPLPEPGRAEPETPKDSIMDASKGFFASRTVWANLIGLAALGLGVAGVDTSTVDTGGLADAATQIVAGLSFVASTLFRVKATKTIGA